MARPRKTAPDQPQEFSYENELQDAEAKMAPEPVKRKGFQPGNQEWKKGVAAKATAAPSMVAFDYGDQEGGPAALQAEAAAKNPHVNSADGNLYLIEGTVQLDRQGGPPARSDQRRIVYATSDEQALQKYVAYFAAMNSPSGFYSVVSAGCSEAIR